MYHNPSAKDPDYNHRKCVWFLLRCAHSCPSAAASPGTLAFPIHTDQQLVQTNGTHSTHLFRYPCTPALSYEHSCVHELCKGCDPAGIRISAGRLEELPASSSQPSSTPQACKYIHICKPQHPSQHVCSTASPLLRAGAPWEPSQDPTLCAASPPKLDTRDIGLGLLLLHPITSSPGREVVANLLMKEINRNLAAAALSG